MWALYGLADYLLYPLIYYVARYRLKLVRSNMRTAFPDKSEAELKTIEHKFYHHFADIMVEIVHGYRASDAEMAERFVPLNLPDVERWAEQNQGCIFMLGHFCNWEWTADVQKRFVNPEMQHYNVYRRLKSKSADEAMNELREKRSGEGSNLEKNTLLRHIVRIHKAGKPFTLGLISDQKVAPDKQFIWTPFLHHNTSFLDGGENLAKKFGYAVTYVHMVQVSRGHYTARVDLITDKPAETEPGYITKEFARRLEANILEQPEMWLWTHNRWKYCKEIV
jgi:KDO2-lipid IV(A) lauroyltransferase